MMRSGYKARFRGQVVHGALAAFQCRLRQDREGTRPLFRPRDYKREERDNDKLCKENSWFRRGGEDDPKAVIFVTATPSSELAEKINNRLKESRIPIKVAEKSGQKLSQTLVRTNPHQPDQCDREDCLVCSSRDTSSKGKANCHKEGVVYSMECQGCPDGAKAIYIGETSSTSYIRGQEHLYQYDLHRRGLKGGKPSVCGRHVEEAHQGDHSVKWVMSVVSQHGSNTHQRQVAEATCIDEIPEDLLINTRGERGTDHISKASGTVARHKPAFNHQNAGPVRPRAH